MAGSRSASHLTGKTLVNPNIVRLQEQSNEWESSRVTQSLGKKGTFTVQKLRCKIKTLSVDHFEPSISLLIFGLRKRGPKAFKTITTSNPRKLSAE